MPRVHLSQIKSGWVLVFNGNSSGPKWGTELFPRLELLLCVVLTRLHLHLSPRKGQLCLSHPSTKSSQQTSEKEVIGCILSADDTCPAVQELLMWKFYK